MVRAARRTRPQLVNMYGITETTVHVTYRPLGARDLQSGSVIGVPIPDLQLYVLDAQHRSPCRSACPARCYVGGAGLARGYLRRPELTARALSRKSATSPASGSTAPAISRAGCRTATSSISGASISR